MKFLIPPAMAKTIGLTRAGRLRDATALIQATLARRPDDASPPAPTGIPTSIPTGIPTAQNANPRPPRNPAPRTPAPRCTLSETLRHIASGGMPNHGTKPAVGVNLPPGAQFLSLTHVSPQGSRDYRLYVPAQRPDRPMPLVVMLHGCTQTPEDFATGTGMNALAEEFGCLVAYPAQPSGANAQNCWNWFRPEDQARDHGEPALIAGLTRAILRDHPADPARVYLAGLSAGGAAAAIVAAAYPDIYSAVGVHSGLPVGSARDVPSAFAAMRSGAPADRRKTPVPTIAFHGLADTTVHPANAEAVLAQALRGHPGLRKAVETGVAPGGRRFQRTSFATATGPTQAEHWQIDGAGHAWAGGHRTGSYTDPQGPDASREMLRFFRQHSLA